MKKLGIGKRALACVVSAATLLTGTTALSALTQTAGLTASAASYDNYAKLLQYSMYFYDANMCGDQVGETGQMEWRDDCHTGDEVTGGFHDAGDHVKFGLPAGYTASTLGWGYYEFKDSYDSLGQTAHFKTIMDYFADFFKKSTKLSGDTVTNFCYQVGDGTQDHDYWGAPEAQEASQGVRSSLWTSSGASDISAEYAAALAVNYLNFGNEEDLKYAKALYQFSKKNNQTMSVPEYGSDDYEDDQAWAAGFLYLATKDASYKSDMDNYFATGNRQWGEVYYTHCWNNVSLGAAALYGEITDNWKWANSYVSKNCTNKDQFLAIQEWGSARLNVGLQLPALVVSKHTSNDYTDWCKAQMGMILGNNSANVNLIVGFDSNSAKNPHHRAASGYNSYNEFKNIDTISATNGHVLVGALVGGPRGSDFSTYVDSVNDYVTNEVAIDYNAALVGAAAGLYETYKTGSVDSSIEGTKGGGVVTTSATTTATTQKTTTTTAYSSTKTSETTTNGGASGGSEASFTVGTEIGTDGSEYKYAEFSPNGAKTATAYFTVKSSDTEASGSFGTWTGEWLQEDFKVNVGSNGECSVTYSVPSNVGSTVKFSVYWPGADSVEITKILLDNGTSNTTTTTTTTTKQTNNTTTTTTTTVTSGNIGDTNANITTGTETGDDGKIYKYAEFAPNGAKSATAYFTVKSDDTEASGSFGTWTGEWLQEDFKVNVGSNGECSVDYNIPSNVGQTVKFSVYWPGADNVDITKIVLHSYSSGQSTTTTNQQPSSNGVYNLDLNQAVDYSKLPATDKMIGWEWAEFGIPANENITKVEVNIKAKSGEIGKWQGAFGSSTSVDPGYWTQTEDMEKTFSTKSGTITWDVDSATSAIIQKEYGGMLKFGIWWIDCTQFTIESITVYTDVAGNTTTTSTAASTTTTTSKTTTATTSKTTTSTTKNSTTTTKNTTASTPASIPAPTIYGDVNLDGKIDISDAVLLNKAAAGAVTLNGQQYANANVCTDEGVGASDAVTLLKFLVSLVKSLPSD
ncbi:glycoside hydrolase family 9 protein [uncultured Ruminococcus sp.]|uniref:glycoside hydrolase family 9 protein n=1 Tax=uncultured Ruminococcus sp. TaxID=165186 RepID=UPI00262E81A8|nr:glycoside hydrolase family 9 protein [uncultured Ruminococcus sp.]